MNKFFLLASLFLSFIFSLAMLFFAWLHNAQGEIYSDTFDVWYTLLIFCSWFLPLFLGFSLVFLCVSLIKKNKRVCETNDVEHNPTHEQSE